MTYAFTYAEIFPSFLSPLQASRSKFSQIQPTFAKFRQILPNSAKFCQILPNSTRFCQILPNSAKFCQIWLSLAQIPDLRNISQPRTLNPSLKDKIQPCDPNLNPMAQHPSPKASISAQRPKSQTLEGVGKNSSCVKA